MWCCRRSCNGTLKKPLEPITGPSRVAGLAVVTLSDQFVEFINWEYDRRLRSSPYTTMTSYPEKITFGEMRTSGVRDVLVYCRDIVAATPLRSAADRWPRVIFPPSGVVGDRVPNVKPPSEPARRGNDRAKNGPSYGAQLRPSFRCRARFRHGKGSFSIDNISRGNIGR